MTWLKVCQPLGPNSLSHAATQNQYLCSTNTKSNIFIKHHFTLHLTRKAIQLGGKFLVFSDKLYYLTLSDSMGYSGF